MTEDDARAWIDANFDEHRVALLTRFVAMVVDENDRQNLISPSTIATIWSRHIADSAQLLTFATAKQQWLDVGTGGGFPGMVVAILGDHSVTMVEPRRRRAEFLEHTVDELRLDAHVTMARVERVNIKADVISARAVASIEKLLQATAHCATSKTRWILPRGESNDDEIARLKQQWELVFHVEHSLTNPGSVVMLADAKS